MPTPTLTITKSASRYVAVFVGLHGGGYSGFQAGTTAEEAAQFAAREIASRGDVDLVLAPEVREALENLRRPKSKTRSIHAGPDLLKALGTRADGNFSGAITTMATRYADVIRQSMPGFSEPEWRAICDATIDPCVIGNLSHIVIVAKVAFLPGLGEKWGIDTASLVDRLRSLTYCQACAVVDVIERFWGSPRLHELSGRDLLIEAGARIMD